MRIIGYAQLLESYRSLTLDNMAQAFGVSSNFIDAELSRFIASGRLPAVIDRVSVLDMHSPSRLLINLARLSLSYTGRRRRRDTPARLSLGQLRQAAQGRRPAPQLAPATQPDRSVAHLI